LIFYEFFFIILHKIICHWALLFFSLFFLFGYFDSRFNRLIWVNLSRYDMFSSQYLKKNVFKFIFIQTKFLTIIYIFLTINLTRNLARCNHLLYSKLPTCHGREKNWDILNFLSSFARFNNTTWMEHLFQLIFNPSSTCLAPLNEHFCECFSPLIMRQFLKFWMNKDWYLNFLDFVSFCIFKIFLNKFDFFICFKILF